MLLTAPRQSGPLELGAVVILHGLALAALLYARAEPAPTRASAPLMAQIVQAAPTAAPAAPRQPKRLEPLAMRTPPRKPPPTPAPRIVRKAAPLTSTTTRAVPTVAPAAPKRFVRVPSPPPVPRAMPPIEAPPPPRVPAPTLPTRTLAAPAAVAAPENTAAAAASTTAPTATPQRTQGGSSSPDENRPYFAALLQQLNRFKVYPPALRKAKIEGRVVLQFTIDAQGRVTASRVKRSSGHDALDAAASRMLTRASPLPAIPGSMGKSTLTLAVPIEYSLLMDR